MGWVEIEVSIQHRDAEYTEIHRDFVFNKLCKSLAKTQRRKAKIFAFLRICLQKQYVIEYLLFSFFILVRKPVLCDEGFNQMKKYFFWSV